MKTYKLLLLLLFAIPLKLFSQAPTINSQPGSKVVCAGADVIFVVDASGSAPLEYEWFRNSTSIGNNNDTLAFNNVVDSLTGTYYCEVRNSVDTAQTTNFQFTVVTAAPTVASASPDSNYCSGSSVQISVMGSGEALNYSWSFNGSPLSTINPFISTNNFSASDTGNYVCTITNACGSTDTSIHAGLIETPQIITPPSSQSVCAGENVSFNIQASGDNLQYQWYEDSLPVSSATDSVFTIQNVPESYSNFISCEVYNSCGSDTSGQVSLTVNTQAQVTAHPISTSICEGQSVTLISTATGTQPIGIQWYKDDSPVIDSINNSLTVTALPNDTSYYYAAFMNTCGTVFSDSAQITTDMPPNIFQHPDDANICNGDTITLTVKANGYIPMNYNWQRNGTDVVDTNATGTNMSNLTLNGVFSGQTGDYTCIASNYCGYDTSNIGIVNVLSEPVVSVQPDDLTICENDTAQLTTTIQGSSPLNYAWTTLASSDTAGTSHTLTFNGINASNAGNYYCMISNQCGTAITDTVDLTVQTYPDFTLQPNELDICHGDSASLLTSATGTEPIDYMWFKNQSALTSQTDTIFTLNPAYPGESGNYMCVAMNVCGITQSDEVLVNVGTFPSFVWGPINQNICENETLILNSNPDGQNVFFQWYLNDQPVVGQDDSTLYIPYVDDAMSGDYYLEAYNGCGSVYSDTANVIINPAPDINLGNDQDLCDGEEVILYAFNDSIQSYNWNNGESYSATYTTNQTGEYTLEAVGSNGCSGYDTVNLEFHPIHYIDLLADGSYCGSQNLDAGEGAYSYIWNTGDTTSSITVSDSGQYYVTTEGDAFGCTDSDTVNLVILQEAHVNIGPDHTISYDSTITVCVNGNYDTYYWNNGITDSCAVYQGQLLGEGEHDIWLTVSLSNGCTDTDSLSLTVESQDAIESLFKNEKLSVYPNPARENIFLDYDLKEEIVLMEIVNLEGKIVKSKRINNKKDVLKLRLEDLTEGYYILKLRTQTRMLNIKLIKS